MRGSSRKCRGMCTGPLLAYAGLRWTGCVREGLEALKMLLNWSRFAKDRQSWRGNIQHILGRTQQNAGHVYLIGWLID